MNNIEFNAKNLNLVQNSHEFKLILYKLSSQIYDFTRYNQPVLFVTSLTFFVVFIALVYYFDAKKIKAKSCEQNTNKEVSVEEFKTTKEEVCENKLASQGVESKLSNIKEEIIELRKELEFFKINKKGETEQIDEENEENEDVENSNKKEQENFNSPNQYVLDKINMEKTISEMTTEEIETFLQICSNYILIPNWYTKEDFEGLTNTKLSTKTWEKILSGSEDYSSLIDDTNAMTVGWFENNMSGQIEKIPYDVSVIEDSDNEESSNYSSNSESDESEELDLLENDDSDEENESDIDNSNKYKIDTSNSNVFITKQLEKLKYHQLKKIAGISNNKLSKSQLIKLIAKDYKKVSIIKALKIIT